MRLGLGLAQVVGATASALLLLDSGVTPTLLLVVGLTTVCTLLSISIFRVRRDRRD